jgi:hypothetical protein
MKFALGLGPLLFALVCACAADSVGESSDEFVTPPASVDRFGRTVQVTASTSLKYYGGKVIPNVKVYVVWWGDGSNLLADLKKPVGGIADFYAGVTDSIFMDGLAEYSTMGPATVGSHAGQPGSGQVIGRGNYAGTIALTSIPPTTNLTDEQIQTTIESAIDTGKLPTPDDNTLFALYFPRSVKITIEGMRSCIYFGAYHSQTPLTRHHAAYAVMPDCGYSYPNVTSVSSHELAEAVTDVLPTPGTHPDYPQAWNDSGGSEVADLCVETSGTVQTPKGPFKVQGNWFESAHGCRLTHTFANEFNIGATTGPTALAAGSSTQLTFQTGAIGSAQPLELSVSAPAGVAATLSATQVNAGEPVTVTLTASPGLTVTDGQVVVTAKGTNGSGAQYHAASQLVRVTE